MLMYFLLLALGAIVSAALIPPIIRLAVAKRLFDMPLEERKVHKKLIPNLGGVAIIFGSVFAYSLVADTYLFENAGIILVGSGTIAAIGLKDDLMSISPLKKFIAQFFAAMLVCILANMRITHMFGIFDVNEMYYFPSVLLSIFTIVGIINAFNLIDGIDGLAGTIGLIVSLVYTAIFALSGDIGWAYFACALAGGIIGFLIFNVSPAKIFMGDTGALFIGFMVSLFTVRFLGNIDIKSPVWKYLEYETSPALAVAILIVPLFDTLRVFTIRILNSESPFKADRNHLHHKLLDLGFSHTKATITLGLVNVVFIAFALVIQNAGIVQTMMSIIILALLANTCLTLYVNGAIAKKKAVQMAKNNRNIKSLAEDQHLLENVLEKISKN